MGVDAEFGFYLGSVLAAGLVFVKITNLKKLLCNIYLQKKIIKNLFQKSKMALFSLVEIGSCDRISIINVLELAVLK